MGDRGAQLSGADSGEGAADVERFRRAFDDAAIGMALIDLGARFTLVNPAFCRIVGYSAAQLCGTRILGLVSSEVSPAERRRLRQVLRQGGDLDFERALRRHDGQIIWARVTFSAARDDSGRPLYYILQCQDVTRHKHALDQLAKAKSSAEAASHAKSMFLSNMSHELRTPLNAVIGFGEIIAHGLLGEIGERYRSYGSDIVHSGRHLLDLIENILDVARLDVGAYTLNLEPIELPVLIDDALRIVKLRLDQAEQILTLPDLPDDWVIVGDKRALRQVLMNLMTNAIKFTPRGGQIRVSAERDLTWQHISVHDTGIGILPKDLDRIFLPFEQVEREHGRFHEGTGLGLPLSRQIAELHGGRLEVQSTPGVGSSFTLSLPRGRV